MSVYAIDFDGVLARSLYPKIGNPIQNNIDYVKELKKKGNTIILWTCRTDNELKDAVNWLEDHDLIFDYVNENTDENIEKYGNDTRKIVADYYIDDKNFSIPETRREVIQTGKMELRATSTEVKIRSAEDGTESRTIEGYALKFNKRSQPLADGFFVETLDSRCLDNTDMSNVVATFNHDESKLLGRSGVNLTLEKDKVGLRFKIDLPNTTLANDVLEEVRMGILSQCSFAFTMPETDDASEWRKSDTEGVEYDRTIRKIDKLYDVSVVTTPAYQDTNVAVGARSKQAIEKLKDKSLTKVRELKRQNVLRKLNLQDLKEGY